MQHISKIAKKHLVIMTPKASVLQPPLRSVLGVISGSYHQASTGAIQEEIGKQSDTKEIQSFRLVAPRRRRLQIKKASKELLCINTTLYNAMRHPQEVGPKHYLGRNGLHPSPVVQS
jgi:hypothetical protein